jgi:predicted nuclease with TOPRIM domain
MAINRTTLQGWMKQLEETIEKKEEALDNAQNAENPNDERIEKLENELALLEEMTTLVEEYISLD